MGGAEIAPAHMHANDHVRGAVFDCFMHHPCIAANEPIGILALRDFGGAVFGVAKISEEDVIHLQIPTPGVVEGVHGLFTWPRYPP